jgi:hypothetical protein
MMLVMGRDPQRRGAANERLVIVELAGRNEAVADRLIGLRDEIEDNP